MRRLVRDPDRADDFVATLVGDPAGKELHRDIYLAFVQWAIAEKVPVASARRMSSALRARGAEEVRERRDGLYLRAWAGVRIPRP